MLVRSPSRAVSRLPVRGPIEAGGLPADLAVFADGTEGFLFDFSRTDLLFQDQNGALADDTGENIRLALESHAWNGRTLAAQKLAATELIEGDAFSPGAAWSATANTFLRNNGIVSGVLEAEVLAAYAGNARAYRSYTVEANTQYVVEGTVAANALGAVPYGIEAFDTGNATLALDTRVTGGDRVAYFDSGARTTVRVGLVVLGTNETVGDKFTLTSLSLKKIVGNHGLQTLSNSQPKWQTGGIARADGSDDGLRTTKKMGAAGFVMVKHLTTSAPASTKVLCGASGASTDYGYCGVDSAGKGVARVGTGAAMTSDDAVTGAVGTLGWWWDGVTAALLVNGVKVKTQAQSGAPTTANDLALFYLNNNGSPGSWLGTDGYRFIHGNTAPDGATLLAFHTKLMAQ